MMVYCVIAAVLVVALIIYLMGFENWLIWAVSQAEKELGSGTGKLKLRCVYDLAIARFPILAKFIPFTLFSKLVDLALENMREMIQTNDKIAEAIEGVAEEAPATIGFTQGATE